MNSPHPTLREYQSTLPVSFVAFCLWLERSNWLGFSLETLKNFTGNLPSDGLGTCSRNPDSDLGFSGGALHIKFRFGSGPGSVISSACLACGVKNWLSLVDTAGKSLVALNLKGRHLKIKKIPGIPGSVLQHFLTNQPVYLPTFIYSSSKFKAKQSLNSVWHFLETKVYFVWKQAHHHGEMTINFAIAFLLRMTWMNLLGTKSFSCSWLVCASEWKLPVVAGSPFLGQPAFISRWQMFAALWRSAQCAFVSDHQLLCVSFQNVNTA